MTSFGFCVVAALSSQTISLPFIFVCRIPSLLQVIGGSRSSEIIPFQVYQNPGGNVEEFRDWFIRRCNSNLADELVKGLYDMVSPGKGLVIKFRSLPSYFSESQSTYVHATSWPRQLSFSGVGIIGLPTKSIREVRGRYCESSI